MISFIFRLQYTYRQKKTTNFFNKFNRRPSSASTNRSLALDNTINQREDLDWLFEAIYIYNYNYYIIIELLIIELI